MNARAFMRSCPTIPDSATVAEVVSRTAPGQDLHFCVVGREGRLVGVITEYDLVKLVYQAEDFDADSLVAGGFPAFLGMTTEELRNLPVTEIMTNDPETVGPETLAELLTQMMFRSRRKLLPVVEAGKLLGAVYRADLVRRVLG